MFCLTCLFASPVGSAFCGRCGRSYGCRVCSSAHRSPMASNWCVVCGKPDKDMSRPTRYVPLAWCSHLAAWSALVAAFLWGLNHVSAVMGGIVSAGFWAVRHLFGTTPCALVVAAYRAMTVLAAIYILTFVLPGKAGSRVRQAITTALSRMPALVWTLARWCWRIARLLVEGSAGKAAKERGQKRSV